MEATHGRATAHMAGARRMAIAGPTALEDRSPGASSATGRATMPATVNVIFGFMIKML